MAGRAITRDRIDELLLFLPRFERPGSRFIKTWSGGQKTAGGALTFPYPIYEEDVVVFFRLAGQPWWSDYQYDPAKAAKMLGDDEFIRASTLDDVRTMLTYCVRGERFGDGHWGHVLETGRVAALLRRLAVLRATLPAGRASLAQEE
jgi:hypothetical protein